MKTCCKSCYKHLRCWFHLKTQITSIDQIKVTKIYYLFVKCLCYVQKLYNVLLKLDKRCEFLKLLFFTVVLFIFLEEVNSNVDLLELYRLPSS